MKYKDNYKHLKNITDKFGNTYIKSDSINDRLTKKTYKNFKKRLKSIDKFWYKTLDVSETKTLFENYRFRGDRKIRLKDFYLSKRERFGSLIKAREMKINIILNKKDTN